MRLPAAEWWRLIQEAARETPDKTLVEFVAETKARMGREELK